MAKKVFVIDIAKCNGCHNCQIVCKDEHVANDWTPIAKPQPEIGQFWLELTERVRGTVPKVKVAYRPHLCMHCDNAPCIAACPVEGAPVQARGRPGHHRPGQVHRLPAAAWTPARTKRHLLQRGPQHRAEVHRLRPPPGRRLERAPLRRCLPDRRPQAHGRGRGPGAHRPRPRCGSPSSKTSVKPRVYYLGLPKKFIAGTLYEPVEEEVVIGATATLEGRRRQGAHHRDRRLRRLLVRGHRRRRLRPGDQERQQGQGLRRSRHHRADINLGDIPLA